MTQRMLKLALAHLVLLAGCTSLPSHSNQALQAAASGPGSDGSGGGGGGASTGAPPPNAILGQPLKSAGFYTDNDPRADQVTIWPMPFILPQRGKFSRIANDAKSCRPSVNAPNTASVVAISSFVVTPNCCM